MTFPPGCLFQLLVEGEGGPAGAQGQNSSKRQGQRTEGLQTAGVGCTFKCEVNPLVGRGLRPGPGFPPPLSL